MKFQEAEQYLLSLGNEVSAMKLGLENIGKLLVSLGNPEHQYLKIQVAGTNGKGSTCAFLEAICVEANIKVGSTTSPHLVSITERVKIGGKEISKKDFGRQATLVREVSRRMLERGELETVPTFFEQITAIALNYFAERKIELAILETGLGGRFDATTAANAEIVALTPVDFDHQDILGNSLAQIAAEKAAVIRENVKVVVVPEQNTEVMNVITQKCKSVNVKLNFSNYRTELLAVDANKGVMSVEFYGDEIYQDIRLGINGRHQLINARLAIGLAEVLRKDFGFKIEKEHVEDGLEKARNKGRLEFYQGILFDGAHNIAGAEALKNYLDEFIKKTVTLIFGAMKDKDLREIAEILFPCADFLIFTKPDNSRSLETTELMKFVPEKFKAQNVFQTETVEEALRLAREISLDKNLICVTGSLYLVGEAQKMLNNS